MYGNVCAYEYEVVSKFTRTITCVRICVCVLVSTKL